MNVDQNQSSESISSKTKNHESKSTRIDIEKNPASSSEQTSSQENASDVPEIKEALNRLSLTSHSENKPTISLQHSISKDKPELVIGFSNIFSRSNLEESNVNVPGPSASKKIDLTEPSSSSLGQLKLFSKLNLAVSHETTAPLENEPERNIVVKHSPESTNLRTQSSNNKIEQQSNVIVEQPRSSQETHQLYFAPNALRESESNVYITPLLTNTNRPIKSVPNVPPSYSTVIKFPPPEQRRQVPTITDSVFSFSNRVPPPSYGQIQLWADSSSTRSSEDVLYGPEPQYAECPRCTVVVITETRYTTSKLTHFTAVGLCLLGCWPCCLLPYFMESCKDTYHYCPLCHHCFGLYSPW